MQKTCNKFNHLSWKKKSQQTCNRRELLRWSKGHLQMQNKAETAHSDLPIAELSSYTIPGKGSALHLSELNFCKEQKSCRLCVCVYTHVCENVHACTRQKSSVIIFFDCFPFYIWDTVLSKPRVHRLNSKDPLISPLPSLLLRLQVCTILPDILPRAWIVGT